MEIPLLWWYEFNSGYYLNGWNYLIIFFWENNIIIGVNSYFQKDLLASLKCV